MCFIMVILEIISYVILFIGAIALIYFSIDDDKPLIQIKEIEISIVDHEENDEKNDGKNDSL